MAMRRFFAPTAVLAAVLILTGCTALSLDPPSVTLVHLELIEASLFEQRFAVRLRVLNPNNREIAIAGLRFEVEVNNQPFARGVSNRPVTLPPLGEALLDVTAVTGLAGLIRQIDEAIRGGSGDMAYRIKGLLVTDAHVSLPFDTGGKLDLRQLSPRK
jgi:LEA14-like dessication related protein